MSFEFDNNNQSIIIILSLFVLRKLSISICIYFHVISVNLSMDSLELKTILASFFYQPYLFLE